MTQNPTPKEDEEYYAVPIIPYEEGDYPEHNESGFCGDLEHECHENPDLVNELGQLVQDGHATPEEADRLYRGKTF